MVISGASKISEFAVFVGKTSGVAPFIWNMYSLPDRMVVSYEGMDKFDTGTVSGEGAKNIVFSGISQYLNVTVFSPGADTAWDFVIGCP